MLYEKRLPDVYYSYPRINLLNQIFPYEADTFFRELENLKRNLYALFFLQQDSQGISRQETDTKCYQYYCSRRAAFTEEPLPANERLIRNIVSAVRTLIYSSNVKINVILQDINPDFRPESLTYDFMYRTTPDLFQNYPDIENPIVVRQILQDMFKPFSHSVMDVQYLMHLNNLNWTVKTDNAELAMTFLSEYRLTGSIMKYIPDRTAEDGYRCEPYMSCLFA